MSKYEGVLCGFGNPLLDISAEVPQSFLDKYDVKLNNAILAEEKHVPIYDDMCSKFKTQFIAGGATQNSIRVAQWMLQEKGATAFFGAVGKDDKYGKQLFDSASADGVSVNYQEDEKESTGTCAVLINNHERSLIANLAAANKFTEDFLNSDEKMAVWNKAQFFYVAGFFLTVSPPTIQRIAKHALANNKVFAMNLSAPFLPQFFKDPMMAALPYTNFLFGNESEAEAFGKVHDFKDTSTEAVALEVAKLECKHKGGRTVVFTQGAEDTIVVQDGKLTKYAVPKIAKEDMVDVNGAGDAFVGGFLSQLIKGKSIKEAVDAGHYAAGYIIRRSGCVLEGVPDWK